MYTKVNISSKISRRFIAGYPWLFSNELPTQALKDLPPGSLITVMANGTFLATGYYNKHSLIAFRALSYQAQQIIDTAFFIEKFSKALLLRELFFTTPYYRLIHAEGDALPGLIIDRFNDVFVLQCNTYGIQNLIEPITQALQSLFAPKTILFKNDSPIRLLEQLTETSPVVIGEPLEILTIKENGAHFELAINHSQKTGWFYDHAPNRRLIATLSKNKTVLDYFCYSGGFSIQAALAGAKKVIGVDRSAHAIKNASHAAQLNGVEQQCTFVCAETFDDMKTRILKQESYDIVILDPPAFVKVKKDLSAGLKGYEKLLQLGLQLLSPSGILLIASCSYHVHESDLRHCLHNALHKAKRAGRIACRTPAGMDHPLHPALMESEYLKGFMVVVD